MRRERWPVCAASVVGSVERLKVSQPRGAVALVGSSCSKLGFVIRFVCASAVPAASARALMDAATVRAFFIGLLLDPRECTRRADPGRVSMGAEPSLYGRTGSGFRR